MSEAVEEVVNKNVDDDSLRKVKKADLQSLISDVFDNSAQFKDGFNLPKEVKKFQVNLGASVLADYLNGAYKKNPTLDLSKYDVTKVIAPLISGLDYLYQRALVSVAKETGYYGNVKNRLAKKTSRGVISDKETENKRIRNKEKRTKSVKDLMDTFDLKK